MIEVIFSTRDRARILEKTLAAFEKVEPPKCGFRVLAVDNGSTDETGAVLGRWSESMPLLCINQPEGGKNQALNTALKRSVADLVVFTDDDILPDRNWLMAFEDAAEKHSGFSIFGGQVHPVWPDPLPNIDVEKLDGYEQHYAVHVLNAAGQYEFGSLPFGPNFAVRRNVLIEVPNFNEMVGPSKGNYIMGSETEFLRRAVNRGHRCYAVPESIVGHQIRPEQTTLDWLEHRAFRSGRHQGDINDTSNSSKLLGIPRYLWRILWRHKRIVRSQSKNPNSIDYWNAKIRYRRIQGWIYQELAKHHSDPKSTIACRLSGAHRFV